MNAANSQMLGCFVPLHTCIDNCIHTFAGVQLRLECARRMAERGPGWEQPTAVPMLTDAYNLPAKKVVHVVGPIVEDRLTPALEQDLADCYENVLDLCRENGAAQRGVLLHLHRRVPLPGRRAAEIAARTVGDWLTANPGAMDRVVFNVFRDEDLRIYEELLRE